MAITLSNEIKQCILDGTGREPDGPIVKDRIRYDEIKIFIGEPRSRFSSSNLRADFLWRGVSVGTIEIPHGVQPGDTLTLTGIEGAFQLTVND